MSYFINNICGKMRYLTILLMLVYFTVIVHSRPPQKDQVNQRVIDEAEYEADPKDGAEEQESYAKQQESVDEEPEQKRRYSDMNKNSYSSRSFEKDRSGQSNIDNSNYRPSKSKDEREINSDDESNVFEGFQFYPKHQKSTRYVQSNDGPETQQTQRNNANGFKSNHNSILTDETPGKRTAQDSKMALSEEGDNMLFESKDQTDKVDKNDYSNEPLDSNHRFSKQYYSVLHSDNRAMPDSKNHENERLYYNRERRNIDSNQPNTDNLTELREKKVDLSASNTEDSETAIKRHILKLSSDELQELLNSLSEEKRSLLRKIIDDTKLVDNDSVHKREITKKAEAVEENSYNENGQIDTGKIQAGNVPITERAIATSTDAASNKQQEIKTDGIDLGNTKSVDTTADVKNSYNILLNNENAAPQKSDDSVSPCANIDTVGKSEIISNEPVTIKNENKREANPNELSDVSETELSDSCPQDEELSELTDEDQSQFDEESKTYKRDVQQQAELDSKMKSLEESFPNSDAYDESPGPLIRVKRKNAEVVMKKRSAALLPDAKVAFFPYRSESDDDDNEEGNEFDDDGFYERAHVCNKNIEEDDNTSKKKYNNFHLNNKEQQTSPNDLNKAAQIGTDTDNILSGVEGVDENLMFSSGSRSRRTTEDNHLSDNVDESNSQPLNSKSLEDENKALSESNANNAPNYQETDAFGPLPRNYDGDLGRFKRIRRVKQSHVEETQSNT